MLLAQAATEMVNKVTIAVVAVRRMFAPLGIGGVDVILRKPIRPVLPPRKHIT